MKHFKETSNYDFPMWRGNLSLRKTLNINNYIQFVRLTALCEDVVYRMFDLAVVD